MASQRAQDFVPIKEIQEGVVVMKDGGLRAVLKSTAVNFSLKSVDEQKAILLAFQSFLNSLDFSVQIVVQSRRKNMNDYLALLASRLKETEEPLMKRQIEEYVSFIKKFTEDNAIMAKNFYVVVTYSAAPLSKEGALGKIFSFGKKDADSGRPKEYDDFEEKKSQLFQRVNVVVGGLQGLGLKLIPLDTVQAVELFYKTFNPGETLGKQSLASLGK